MWYKNVGTNFFLVVKMYAFDRRTNREKGLGNIVRCITCSRTVISTLEIIMLIT